MNSRLYFYARQASWIQLSRIIGFFHETIKIVPSLELSAGEDISNEAGENHYDRETDAGG